MSEEQIEGKVKSILFRNSDNHYSVVKLQCTKPKGEVISTGIFPEIVPGEDLIVHGKWTKHAKFGEQFAAQNVEIQEPAEIEAVIRHLSSGIYRKIGPKTAETIANHFGDDTMNILRENPSRIGEVPRFPSSKVKKFVEDWNEHQGSRDVLYFLHQHQVHASIAMRIYKRFGVDTLKIIQTNPYILAEELWGIGFLKADQIARHFDIELDSSTRLKAALEYCLSLSTRDGHTFLTQEELFDSALKILTEPEIQSTLFILLKNCLKEMAEEKQVIQVDDRVFQPSLYYEEEYIGIWTKRRLGMIPSKPKPYWKKQLKTFEKTEKIDFSEEQRSAILEAAASSFFILTGGPGTGKTTLLKGLLAAIEHEKVTVKLAAPTGRAAKRMEEMSQQKAFTLHRLLEYNPQDQSFVKNDDSQLSAQYIIVDEASMMDTWLMSALMKAIPPSSKLILIGDKDQLPSVGPGQVLSNLLDVEELPKVVLKRIFRQEAGSDIPYNANKILHGEMPEFTRDTNFHIREHQNPQQAQELVRKFCSEDIPNYFKVDPIKDIQVLTPMRKGMLGTFELNKILQSALNGQSASFKIQGMDYYIGDKLMQIRNNYDKNIYNGDIGYLFSVDTKSKTFKVLYDDLIEYEFSEMDEITLAYATTIHKSQGSEYPIALIVLDPSHRIMLQRNLVYTAITRAKDRVFLISPTYCIQQCVQDNRVLKRNTHLLTHLNVQKSVEENFMAEAALDKSKDDFMDFLEEEAS